MTKLVCIKAYKEFLGIDNFIVGEIYEIDDRDEKLFPIGDLEKGKDEVYYYFPNERRYALKSHFIPLSEYREKQLNKLGID